MVTFRSFSKEIVTSIVWVGDIMTPVLRESQMGLVNHCESGRRSSSSVVDHGTCAADGGG